MLKRSSLFVEMVYLYMRKGVCFRTRIGFLKLKVYDNMQSYAGTGEH